MRSDCKLTKEGYDLVLQLHAQGERPSDIVRYLNEKEIPHPSLVRIAQIPLQPGNAKKIEFFKQKYLSEVNNVPIANKRIRLDMLQRVTAAIDNTLPKILNKKDQIQPKQFKKFLSLTKRLNELLISARDEMEKKPQFQLVQIQGNNFTMEELINEERDIDRKLGELRQTGVSVSISEKERFEIGAPVKDQAKSA